MSSRGHRPKRSRFLLSAIKRYPNAAMELLDGPRTWTRNPEDDEDTIELGDGPLEVFHQCGVITSIGTATRSKGNIWRTNLDALSLIEEHIATRTRTPCGCSTGIRTVESGEVYTCRNDDCDERFDKETALEVVG